MVLLCGRLLYSDFWGDSQDLSPAALLPYDATPLLRVHRIRQKGLETALSVPKSLPHPTKARDVAITTIAISSSPTHKRTFLVSLRSDLAYQSFCPVFASLPFVRTFRALKKDIRCKNVGRQTGIIQRHFRLPKNSNHALE